MPYRSCTVNSMTIFLMRGAALLTLLCTGCFNPNYGNGALQCDDGRCPSGYHCAADDACWIDGTGPDGGIELDLAAGDR
jgi:hypothetical protein